MYRPYLAHYGVKGMKWGVRRQRKKSAARQDREAWKSMSRKDRKVNRDNRNKRYSQLYRDIDKQYYGEGGVKRINRRMNKGQSYFRARLTEGARLTAVGTAATGAAVAGLTLYSMGPEGRRILNNYAKMDVQSLINSAKAKNAARRAREQIPRLVANVSQNRTIKLKPWQYKVSR